MLRRKSKSAVVDTLESRLLFSAAAAARLVMGYIPDYELSNGNAILSETGGVASGTINWAGLSQVNYFAVLPDSSGNVQTDSDQGLSSYASQLAPLVTAAHAHNVAVYVTAGAGDTAAITDMDNLLATGGSAVTTFATQLAAAVKTNKADGVDLDWEPQTATTVQVNNFGTLIADLRAGGLNVSADTLPGPFDIGDADPGAASGSTILPFNSTALANLSTINIEEYTDGSFTYPDTNTFAGEWVTALGAANTSKIQFGVGPYNTANGVTQDGTVDEAETFMKNNSLGGMFVWTLGDSTTYPDLAEIDNDYAGNSFTVAPGSTASIAGTVSDGSGPLSGVKVFIDANGNGTLDSGETSYTTGADGSYYFPGLAAGTYKVVQQVPTGETQTTPASGTALSVTVTQGQVATGQNFTDSTGTTPPPATGSISGTVSTSNGAISGVTVFLDTNGDGKLDDNEPSLTTGANGTYSFTGLSAGNYSVVQEVPTGDTQTTPANGAALSVTLSAGQNATGENFVDSVNTLPPPTFATVTGTVTNSSSVGIDSITVYLDANNDRSLDNGEVSVTTSGPNGAFTFSNVPTTANTDYIVRQVLPSGDTQTTPTDGNGYHLPATLSSGSTYSGNNFVDSVPVTPPPPTGATVSGKIANSSGIGVAGITVYLDANNNRSLDTGEMSTTTLADGTYTFSDVPVTANTDYIVRQLLPAGDVQTSPTDSNGLHLPATLTAGTTYGGENFVDSVPASTPQKLSGTVFGTAGSYMNDGNVAANAFDGNLNTFFDAPTAGTDASPNVVGLDLGSTYTITAIAYAARSGFGNRMEGGIFQASNDSTFNTGVVDMYRIGTGAPAATSLTTVSITLQGSYRYVRYLSPGGSYGNVAEIEFFGMPASAAPLTGSYIGTAGTYQNAGNVGANAFDGNLSTFFDGPTASGDWVGLNLGAEYSITSISFAPRLGFASRMVGGIFQASNDPTFTTGVVNLYTIGTTPPNNVLTTVSISTAGSFQYVRYLAPAGSYGNVAEIEFFGDLVG